MEKKCSKMEKKFHEMRRKWKKSFTKICRKWKKIGEKLFKNTQKIEKKLMENSKRLKQEIQMRIKIKAKLFKKKSKQISKASTAGVYTKIRTFSGFGPWGQKSQRYRSRKMDMERIEEMFASINNNTKQTNEKLDKLIQELNQVKEENTKLTKKVEEQNERIEMLEREIRGKNLIIKGIKEDINECEEVTREKILNSAKNLKGSDIWIDEGYTKKVQEERKKLIPLLKEAREKGQTAYLIYDKLKIYNKAGTFYESQ
ncbi:hypothetical protein RN001_008928 [Aquatica leii]|uniref:Uncharacterized protein n=1 Tax=Aquatica leii TaxID=1421715 RepID=A0AAN7PA90_9COLE|nr:hypothetical protein RN001_008928 [Aquatica leii]